MNPLCAWNNGAINRWSAQQTRAELEYEVQNLIGPIVNIAKLSNAQLYGIRDEVRAHQRIVGNELTLLEGEK